MRNIIFANGEYYHIYARGVDKRDICIDDDDRRRFVASAVRANIAEHSRLVAIVAYVLMNNHYHLLVQQIADAGVSRYASRLGNSYTKYFNVRWGRAGRLFSSPFQAKHVENTKYLQHLTRYIHRNPAPNRQNEHVMQKLERYPWSSYRHYLGLEHQYFIEATVVINDFRNGKDYRDFMHADMTHASLGDNLRFDEID